jgi:hypothetical protein
MADNLNEPLVRSPTRNNITQVLSTMDQLAKCPDVTNSSQRDGSY